MDARVRDSSQSERQGIKRTWDEEGTFRGKDASWNGQLLPPIDSAPQHAQQFTREMAAISHNRYSQDPREPESKRPRYERNEWYPPTEERFEMNGRRPQSRSSHILHESNGANQGALQSPSYPSQQRGVGWGIQGGEASHYPGQPSDTTNLCQRCRKVLAHPEDVDSLESGEKSESVTQAAAAALNQLADTLSGISSGQGSRQREMARLSADQPGVAEFGSEYPPIAQYGLQHTLSWILGRIQRINILADKLVQNDPPSATPKIEKTAPQNGNISHECNPDAMKRRLDADLENVFPLRIEPDSAFDGRYTKTRERAAIAEERPPTRSPYAYQPPQKPDAPDPRNNMNPPLAPTRQLPSPPGRSIPSPTSISFPSPSAASFGSSSQPVNLPPPSSLHPPGMNNFLPPISTGRPSDPAMQAHSAALQHEVSVQKIALSSLQTEHDKLLAAYLRSQTRASALEKKHNVSDAEIITLSEEKIRLQQQVLELEKDIEDISRSRDECREAAVKEGTQYVDIVRKASQLELMAAEERKSWNIMKTEMEQRISALKTACGQSDARAPAISPALARTILPSEPLKVEVLGEALRRVTGANDTTHSADVNDDLVGALEEEVRRLRQRCFQMESALNAVKDDSRSMENLVQALGLARKSILERANKALEPRVEI